MTDARKDKIKALLAKRNASGAPSTSLQKDLPKKKKVIIDDPLEKKVVEKVVINPDDYSSEDSEIDEEAGFDWEQVKNWKNKQRTMVVGSRGIAAREKHIMMDLMMLLPHSKKEAKLEKAGVIDRLIGICEMNSCQNMMYFEQRKRGKHLYLWMGKAPNGPSVKFAVENIHTTRELKMIGNCLKYSRPMLSFDKAFDTEPQLKVLKELFIDTFGAPKNHPKTKPFVDHTFNFTWADNRVWFRNFQIFREQTVNNKASDDYELIEIGPRMSLCPIRLFEGFMCGQVLYANPSYIAPRMVNRQKNKELEEKFMSKDKKRQRRADMLKKVLPSDDIDKLYDDELHEDSKAPKKKGPNFGEEDGDSDLYEENDDDFDE